MFPRISGGKIWLPFSVETEDGLRGCGMYELPPDDPSYQETKKWLEALERGAALYRQNPLRAVIGLIHELPELPPDPRYAKIKKRLEALERNGLWFASCPEEDELAEINRFTKADDLGAWKLAPPVITLAEWRDFCYQLFAPLDERQEKISAKRFSDFGKIRIWPEASFWNPTVP